MRFIVWSDLQANAHKPFSKVMPNGLNSRLADAISIIDQITELHRTREIPYSFFLGDLFHTRNSLDISTLSEVYKALKRLSRYATLFILVGNHDQTLRSGQIHSPVVMDEFAIVLDHAQEFELMEHQFSVCPYTPDDEKLLDEISRFEHRDYLLLHAGISEATVGPYDALIQGQIAADKLKDWKLAFVGHYHKRQTIGNVYIPGSPLQVDFGEMTDPSKGCLIVDEYDVEFVPLEYPNFIKLEIDSLDDNTVDPLTEVAKGNYLEVAAPPEIALEVARKFPGIRVTPIQLEKPVQVRLELKDAQTDEALLTKYIAYRDSSPNALELLSAGLELLKDANSK